MVLFISNITNIIIHFLFVNQRLNTKCLKSKYYFDYLILLCVVKTKYFYLEFNLNHGHILNRLRCLSSTVQPIMDKIVCNGILTNY